MRDEDFVGVDNDHYIPNHEFYTEKQHYKKRRSKSKNKLKILSNLYPTLQIRNWLQWIVEVERPTLCRTTESYAIFRKFTEQEAEKHWGGGLRTRYTENLTKLIGKGINSARHTYTQNGLELGIGWGKLQSSLGQIPNEIKDKSIRSYAREREDELDLVHIDILDECEIVEIYFQLVFFLKEQKPFRGIRKTFFPKWFFKDHEQFAYMMGEKLGLIGWTYKDEFRLQKLEKK